MKYIFASILILLFSFVGLTDPIRGVFQSIFTPVQFGLKSSAVYINDTFSFYTNLSRIRQENLDLIQQNQNLKTQISQLKIHQEENQLLREQLELPNDSIQSRKNLLARVLRNPEDPTGNTIFIDKGRVHGVTKNDNIVVGNNLIGMVKEVSQVRSRVVLISSPEISISVYDVDSPDKTEGIVTGNFGTTILMDRILPTEQINMGDTVLSSGKDGLIVPDLVLGNVSEIIEESAEPLKSAIIDPVVNLGSIDKVFVLLSE